MRRIVLLMSLLTIVGTAHAVSWTDLWLTPEQQAQRLLASGKAADAAHKFKDMRRRAYAEIEAGQYAEAAQLLENFRDPQSQYNRGNALARAGHLENAIAAYDIAIKQTTAESALGRDARHNRELVAEQLKKQQSSHSQAEGQSGADEQPSATEHPAKQDQQQSGNQSQTSKQDQTPSGSQSQSDSGGKSEQRDRGQQHADKSGKQQHAQAQRDAAAPGKEKADRGTARTQGNAGSATAQQKSPSTEQTNDSLAKQANLPSDRNSTPAAATQELPLSEQTLALDQWLRQIPDDPAGLLRRKFLIEHLRRRGAQEEPQ